MINYVYIWGGQKKTRPVKNRKEYFTIRNTPENQRNFMNARKGDKKSKLRQKQFNYNDLLPDGVLKGCSHTASTFAHDIDCGDEALCRETAQKLLDHKDEIQLLELSVSSGWGLHAICRRELGKTIREQQVRLSTITQTEMDTSAHDQQRVMFTGPATDDVLLYLDDAIFEEPLSVEEAAEEYKRLKEREKNGLEEIPASARKAKKHYKPWEENEELRVKNEELRVKNEELRVKNEESAGDKALTVSDSRHGSDIPLTSDLSFKGRPYSDIIQHWWKLQGGEPQEGERNVKLYQLAVNLRAICDNNKETLLAVMPRMGLDEQEIRSIVDSACKEPPKGISKQMREVLGMDTQMQTARQDISRRLWEWGERIEAMMPEYPILRDICKGLKRNQYPAALFVAGGLLMTLMTRCTYRFYHRPEELRRLNNSTLIIGDPASGKSFATRLYNLIAAPILESDKIGIGAINAYREQMKTKGANKEKPKKPEVVIRDHPARTSNAQFIQDMVNAKEMVDGVLMQLHMLTFDTELDNTMTVQKGGSWIDKQALQLKAFHNEVDGQAYSNVDSVFQKFVVVWNFIYTGTPLALKKMVNVQNFGTGLATRLTCIPLPTTDFEMISREPTIDLESDARISEWAEKLDKTKGKLSVDKIVDELYDWTARRMLDAKENNSKASEMLLKRCAYHGLNFSAPFIVMRHWSELHQDGNFWCGDFQTDETDWKLAELIVNMQFACQRHYFGAMAEAYFDNQFKEDTTNVMHIEKTVEAFERLPEVFTIYDVIRCFNSSSEGTARMQISRLLKDRLIENEGKTNVNGETRKLYHKTGISIT